MRTVSWAGRRALGLCGIASMALLAAACGTASAPTSGSSSKPPTLATPGPTQTVTVTPTPKPAGPGKCSAADLKLTIGQANGAAGTVYYPVEFTDTSGSACTLYGFPGVAFVSKPGGRVIGAPADRSAADRDLITLDPGVTAHATLAVSDVLIENNCSQHQVPVRWLQVFPPDQYAALFARFSPPNGHGCADKSLVVMHVSPVTWGTSG